VCVCVRARVCVCVCVCVCTRAHMCALCACTRGAISAWQWAVHGEWRWACAWRISRCCSCALPSSAPAQGPVEVGGGGWGRGSGLRAEAGLRQWGEAGRHMCMRRVEHSRWGFKGGWVGQVR